jgi:site-specific DNA recombinase
MKKAIAYLRCSDVRQDKSIEDQRAEIVARVACEGYVIVRWYIDEGLTGTRSDRPRYRAMLKAAKQGRLKQEGIDRAYLWKLNRLGRNQRATLEALHVLEDEGGLRVVSLTEAEPEDAKIRKAFRSFVTLMDELFCDNLAEDVSRGMTSRARQGFWVNGRPPYGYRVQHDDQGKNGRLVMESAEADVVQRIAHLYLGGLGFKAVAARLTRERRKPPSREAKVKTRRPAGMWRSKHVRELLTNPVYYGAIKYKGEVVCEDAHEAIIDKETWDAIQAMRAARYRKPGIAGTLNRGEIGALRPLLHCGVCGGSMKLNRGGRSASGRIWYYVCANRAENSECCRGINARVDHADEVLLNAIEALLLTPEALDRLIRETIEHMGSTADQQAREVRETIQTKLDGLEVQIANVTHAVALGAIQVEDAARHTAPLYAERDRLARELAALPEPRPVPRFEDVDRQAFREALSAAWRSKDMGVRRRALDRLIDNIVLEPGSATISYSWKAEAEHYHHHAPYGPL